jgi:spore coat polysaccharide biosynthesis predicted glycosyltransferase SpsG
VTALDGTGVTARRVARERDLADTLAEGRHARAVVVDSYSLDARYLAALVAGGCRVVAIDDAADRELPVDLVVNPSATPAVPRYRGALHTQYLVGPQYAMLQPEFGEPPARAVADRVRRVLVTLGGGDPGPLAAALVRWTAACLDDVAQDVVVGPWGTSADGLRDEPGRSRGAVRLHEHPRQLRPLMLGADLAISAGGQTAYELAAAGTPTIAIRRAANQTLTLGTLAAAGALVAVGDATDPALESAVTVALQALAKDRDRRAEMSRRARAAVDGQGAARVARAVLSLGGAA